MDPALPALVRLRLRAEARARLAAPEDEQGGTLKVLLTGSAGFLGGYVVAELLSRGHEVVGLDNVSKYGCASFGSDDPRCRLVEGDARDANLVYDLLEGCDHFIAAAAMVGGIAYYHAFAYDLLAANMRIASSACDGAIRRHREGSLRKVTFVSSSMVYESATSWPSCEGQQLEIPPPRSAYGFGQLALEYLARAAHAQYGLAYTIVRPFNCVGVGERPSAVALSHVIPDLVQKALAGDGDLRVLGSGEQERCYIHGADLARGIVTAMEHPAAENQDFNLSTPRATTVLELAAAIWAKVHGPEAPLRLVHDDPFPNDVQRQIASTEKARRLLGFEASTSLDDVLDEVIPWVESALMNGADVPAENAGRVRAG
jgi:nucleoside-diphosphate-sugar epimerase